MVFFNLLFWRQVLEIHSRQHAASFISKCIFECSPIFYYEQCWWQRTSYVLSKGWCPTNLFPDANVEFLIFFITFVAFYPVIFWTLSFDNKKMKETRLGHCKVRTRDVKKTKDSFYIQCNPLYHLVCSRNCFFPATVLLNALSDAFRHIVNNYIYIYFRVS